jgi:hypothetical protein
MPREWWNISNSHPNELNRSRPLGNVRGQEAHCSHSDDTSKTIHHLQRDPEPCKPGAIQCDNDKLRLRRQSQEKQRNGAEKINEDDHQSEVFFPRHQIPMAKGTEQ